MSGKVSPAKSLPIPSALTASWALLGRPRAASFLGRSIVYIKDDPVSGVSNLWEQPLRTRQQLEPPKQVTNLTDMRIWPFAWSPDGKQLLLARGATSAGAVMLPFPLTTRRCTFASHYNSLPAEMLPVAADVKPSAPHQIATKNISVSFRGATRRGICFLLFSRH